MKTGTIFDLIEEYPRYDYEGAKKDVYTDDELSAFLSKNQSADRFDFIEVEASWTDTIENFSKDYPISFWSFIAVILLCISWALIFCVWKAVKLVLYQTIYTIVKAVKDACTNLPLY